MCFSVYVSPGTCTTKQVQFTQDIVLISSHTSYQPIKLIQVLQIELTSGTGGITASIDKSRQV